MHLNKREATKLFMLTAAASASLVEIVPILDALYRGQSLIVVLLLGLAYQIGNGLAGRVGGSPKVIFAMACFGLIAWMIPGPILAIQIVAVATLSASLQACRRAYEDTEDRPKIRVAQKRAWRVAGFLLAAILPATAAVSGVVVVLAFGTVLLRSVPRVSAERKVLHLDPVQTSSSLHQQLWALMVVHQTHYFVYAYAILHLAFHTSSGSVAMAAVAFAVGWITYLSAERLWHRFPHQRVFIAGHTFLTACLLGMSWVGENSWISVLLWVMTGLGGGSVYCLTFISTQSGLLSTQLRHAEDVGHVGGVVLALILVAAGGVGVSGLALAGAVLAATAAMALQLMSPQVSAMMKLKTLPSSRKE